MAIEIDKLLKMLKCDQDEKTQKRAIEEGKKVKHISVFFQTGHKNIWDNCAKIIASHSDKELKIYLRKCLEWLQDANWPGYDVIYNRIKMFVLYIYSTYIGAVLYFNAKTLLKP